MKSGGGEAVLPKPEISTINKPLGGELISVISLSPRLLLFPSEESHTITNSYTDTHTVKMLTPNHAVILCK